MNKEPGEEFKYYLGDCVTSLEKAVWRLKTEVVQHGSIWWVLMEIHLEERRGRKGNSCNRPCKR